MYIYIYIQYAHKDLAPLIRTDQQILSSHPLSNSRQIARGEPDVGPSIWQKGWGRGGKVVGQSP